MARRVRNTVMENTAANALALYVESAVEAHMPELLSAVTVFQDLTTIDSMTFKKEGALYADAPLEGPVDYQSIMTIRLDSSGVFCADLVIRFSVMPEMIQISLEGQSLT
jgi:hypothetical protein